MIDDGRGRNGRIGKMYRQTEVPKEHSCALGYLVGVGKYFKLRYYRKKHLFFLGGERAFTAIQFLNRDDAESEILVRYFSADSG